MQLYAMTHLQLAQSVQGELGLDLAMNPMLLGADTLLCLPARTKWKAKVWVGLCVVEGFGGA